MSRAKGKLPTGPALPASVYKGFTIDIRPLTHSRGPIMVWTVLCGTKELVRDTAPNDSTALERARAYIDIKGA